MAAIVDGMSGPDNQGAESGRPNDQCLRCSSPIAPMGALEFRVGGTSGGWKLLFGELAELGENLIPLEAFGCATCGHVELRLPGPADRP